MSNNELGVIRDKIVQMCREIYQARAGDDLHHAYSGGEYQTYTVDGEQVPAYDRSPAFAMVLMRDFPAGTEMSFDGAEWTITAGDITVERFSLRHAVMSVAWLILDIDTIQTTGDDDE